MSRRTLVSFLVVVALAASTVAAQVGDEARAVGVVSFAELTAPLTHVCPRPSGAELALDAALVAPAANAAEITAQPARVWLPEPPAWMVWLSGIAVAAVIAVRRSRRGGL